MKGKLIGSIILLITIIFIKDFALLKCWAILLCIMLISDCVCALLIKKNKKEIDRLNKEIYGEPN